MTDSSDSEPIYVRSRHNRLRSEIESGWGAGRAASSTHSSSSGRRTSDTIPLRKRRTIHAITGSFRKFSPLSQTITYGSSTFIIFALHNNQEMAIDPTSRNPEKTRAPKDLVDVRVLYWLASGFLPRMRNNCRVVTCLQDPIIDIPITDNGRERKCGWRKCTRVIRCT
jgi:hypothetical protein